MRRGVDGAVIAPGDLGYDEVRRVWNAEVDRRPLFVARPNTAVDVRSVVEFSARRGIPLAVRGGGHSHAGFGTADGAAVLDLRSLGGVRVDPVKRELVTGGGALWGPVDAATQLHHLGVTGADAPQVGVGGVLLGGGFGWLHRLTGLTCDSLLEADVVTANGDLVTASPEREPALFWALRGGGGNFGVVTRMGFRLHPVRELVGGTLLYPLGRGRSVLMRYQELCDSAPDELALRVTLMTAPKAGHIPAELRGKPAISVGMAAFGPPGKLETVKRGFRPCGPAAVDTVRPLTYAQLQQPVYGKPDRLRADGHSSFFARLDEQTIDAFLDLAERFPSPQTMLQVQHLGGAISRLGAADTAFSFRHATHLVACNVLAVRDATSVPLRSWTMTAAKAIRRHELGGPYVNFVNGGEPAKELHAAYSPVTYRRLAQVKAEYDPDNLFRFNVNIGTT
ncbi:FAD linked oxidase domain-containing protein [Amycolatopsis decaplanina DSM 44594]|uniref:FAD linked oxidase domain-containing protein n=1 Tax=Amycolatopsis decaplanina DSM 44594 TaxID=1284240 RepID=M2ZB90_9PSEU|nr:FAD linked oxidase domain-containing protein [Amycolatopsis decaplanina DSM 44594]